MYKLGISIDLPYMYTLRRTTIVLDTWALVTISPTVHPYLISMSMSSDDNGLVPSRNQSWYSLAYDWLPEHRATKDITNGPIGAPPHFLELEL